MRHSCGSHLVVVHVLLPGGVSAESADNFAVLFLVVRHRNVVRHDVPDLGQQLCYLLPELHCNGCEQGGIRPGCVCAYVQKQKYYEALETLTGSRRVFWLLLYTTVQPIQNANQPFIEFRLLSGAVTRENGRIGHADSIIIVR